MLDTKEQTLRIFYKLDGYLTFLKLIVEFLCEKFIKPWLRPWLEMQKINYLALEVKNPYYVTDLIQLSINKTLILPSHNSRKCS